MRTSGFACESSEVACAVGFYLRRSSLAVADVAEDGRADRPHSGVAPPEQEAGLDKLFALELHRAARRQLVVVGMGVPATFTAASLALLAGCYGSRIRASGRTTGSM